MHTASEHEATIDEAIFALVLEYLDDDDPAIHADILACIEANSFGAARDPDLRQAFVEALVEADLGDYVCHVRDYEPSASEADVLAGIERLSVVAKGWCVPSGRS